MRTVRFLAIALLLLSSLPAARAALFAPDEPEGPRPSPCTLLAAVRHAEKDLAGGSDPALSEAGRARALALAETLAQARVSAVLVSPTRRTRETAAPLAARAEVEPQTVPLEGGLDAHVTALAKAVRAHAGGTVVMVGHSNTVPALLRSLGVAAGGDLADEAYGDLFVVTLCEDEPPRLVRGSFGAAASAPPSSRPMR